MGEGTSVIAIGETGKRDGGGVSRASRYFLGPRLLRRLVRRKLP